MTGVVDCSDLERNAVIRALWQASGAASFFATVAVAPPAALPTDDDIAAATQRSGAYIDYLAGRVMKIAFDKYPLIEPWLYDRDNGEGAAARVIAGVRRGGD